MALTVLERLPGMVREALADADRQAGGLECAERTVLNTLRMCDAAGARLEEATAELRRVRREVRRLRGEAHRRRRELGRLPAPPVPPPVSGRRQPHRILAEALESGRVTVGRVAALVDARAGDVAALAAGRVGLSRGGWRRLLAALDTGAGPTPAESCAGTGAPSSGQSGAVSRTHTRAAARGRPGS